MAAHIVLGRFDGEGGGANIKIDLVANTVIHNHK